MLVGGLVLVHGQCRSSLMPNFSKEFFVVSCMTILHFPPFFPVQNVFEFNAVTHRNARTCRFCLCLIFLVFSHSKDAHHSLHEGEKWQYPQGYRRVRSRLRCRKPYPSPLPWIRTLWRVAQSNQRQTVSDFTHDRVFLQLDSVNPFQWSCHDDLRCRWYEFRHKSYLETRPCNCQHRQINLDFLFKWQVHDETMNAAGWLGLELGIVE